MISPTPRMSHGARGASPLQPSPNGSEVMPKRIKKTSHRKRMRNMEAVEDDSDSERGWTPLGKLVEEVERDIGAGSSTTAA